MLTIEEMVLPKKEVQHMMGFPSQSLQGLKEISLGKNILLSTRARNISYNEAFFLYPYYSETIFSHINFFGGYQ